MLTALLPLTVASFHPPLASRRGCILATSSARSRFVHASSADGDAFDPNAFFQRALTALPENPETAELQLRSGLRAALDAGERRILLDVRVPELDAASRGFMPQLLARFALAASQEAAVGNLPVLTLCHSLDASMQASLLTREIELGDGELPQIVALGPLAPAAEELAAHEGPVIVVGPSGAAEHPLSSGVRKGASAQQPIVLLNFAPPPGLVGRVLGATARSATPEYTSAFEMVPVALRKLEADGDTAAPNNYRVVPKALLRRRYPEAWKLLVNAGGAGYVEVRSFDTRPSEAALVREVTAVVGELQTSAGPPGGAEVDCRSGTGDGAVARGGTGRGAVGAASDPEPPAGAALPDGTVACSWE